MPAVPYSDAAIIRKNTVSNAAYSKLYYMEQGTMSSTCDFLIIGL